MYAFSGSAGNDTRAAIRPSTAGLSVLPRYIAAQPPGQSSAAHASSVVTGLPGYKTAASRSRPKTGPGKIRRAAWSLRAVPQLTQLAYGSELSPGNSAVAASALTKGGGSGD